MKAVPPSMRAPRRLNARARDADSLVARDGLLFERSPCPMVVIDEQSSGFVAVNSAALRLYGYSRKEFLRKKAADICPPGHQPRLPRLADGSDRSQTIDLSEERHVRGDGTVIAVAVGSSAILYDERKARLMSVCDLTGRQQAEAALRQCEQRLAFAVGCARIGMFEWEVATGEMLWTQQVSRMLGIKKPKAATLAQRYHYRDWTSRVHPDDLPRVEEEMRRSMTDHTPFDIEFRVWWPDLSEHWLVSRGVGRYDANDRPERMLGIVMDISARKRAEKQLQHLNATLEQRVVERSEALRASEERFRRIFYHAAMGIAITNWQGAVQHCNRAFCLITGYSQTKMRGRTFPELVHPADRARGRELVQRLRRGEIPLFEIEHRFRPKGGVAAWGHTFASALRDRQGRRTHLIALVTDITERRRAQEAMVRSEEALAAFFASAPVGLIWLGPAGRVMRTNLALLLILGRTQEEVLDRLIVEWDAGGELAAALPSLMKSGRPLQNLRARLRRKDGTIVHVLVDATVVREGNRLVRSDWFVRDITRQVSLEREILEIAERERHQIGHELHDDLGQILHAVSFLAEELKARLQREGRAEAIEVDRMTKILDQALETTRSLAWGLQPVLPVPAGLMNALREHAERVRQLYGVRCRFVCPKLILVRDRVVATHLFRIAQESVTNACKHARCRRIVIRLKTVAQRLQLVVSDDGHGRQPKPAEHNGIGLRVMQFRASSINGLLEVQHRPGIGTAVVCSVELSPHDRSDPRHHQKVT